jgi:phosphoribosylamine-glycine ligase
MSNATLAASAPPMRSGRLVARLLALGERSGRVLTVVGTGETMAEAREQAYMAVDQIDFPGAQFRRDVAAIRSRAASDR